MIKNKEYMRFKGKGEHSINELEKIIEQREEELHLIKSGDVVKNNVFLDGVSVSYFKLKQLAMLSEMITKHRECKNLDDSFNLLDEYSDKMYNLYVHSR